MLAYGLVCKAIITELLTVYYQFQRYGWVPKFKYKQRDPRQTHFDRLIIKLCTNSLLFSLFV